MVKLMNGCQMSLIRLMRSPSLQSQLTPGDLTCLQPVCVFALVHVGILPFEKSRRAVIMLGCYC